MLKIRAFFSWTIGAAGRRHFLLRFADFSVIGEQTVHLLFHIGELGINGAAKSFFNQRL
jgi:hypothetical protein